MAKRHLHHEAGGDPAAQGPVRELANEPASPQDPDEFPDVPPGNEAGSDAHPRPPDQPDPDRFAERFGVRSEEPRPEEDTGGRNARDRAAVALQQGVQTSRSLAAKALSTLAEFSTRLSERVRPEP